MMNRFVADIRAYSAILALLLLAGCADGDAMVELQDRVQSVINRPPGQIEPLPEFVSYESFTYSAASLRSPFDVPIDITQLIRNQRSNQVQPDENRVREPLESYALGSLVMLGTIERGGQTWALIRDDSGLITRVTVGNYMGRNHGRVIEVGESQVELVEIVPTGDGGWIERPESIRLQQ